MTLKGKLKRIAIPIVCAALAALSLGGCEEDLRDRIVVIRHPSAERSADESEKTYVNYEEDGTAERRLASKEELEKVQLSYASEYFSSYLAEDEQQVCRQLYYGILNFEEKIDITEGVVKQEDICSFLALCTSCAPQLDYIGTEYTIIIDSDGYVKSVELNYVKSKEQAEIDNAALEAKVSEIISGFGEDWGDYEKVKYIHDTIIRNCSYDETGGNCYTAVGCLLEGKAVCEGYAKAFQLVCSKAGIGCIPVIGSGVEEDNTQSHIWNKAVIDNRWYNFDLTWDDPVSSLGDDYLRYDYFAVPDEEMNVDHLPDDNIFLTYPAAASEDANYFMRNGLYAENSDDAAEVTAAAVEKAMSENDDYARIKCADTETFEKTVSSVFEDETDGRTKIFAILSEYSCRYPEMGYSSLGYSIIKNEHMNTITVKLNRQ